jgi:hypothetical protein
MWPSPHDEARQGIGARMLGACPPDEADRIARQVSECAEGTRLRSAMHWIGAAYPPARHGVTVIADAVAFCRLMAGRRAPADLRIEVDGDVRAATDPIQVAATPGGD